MWVHPNFLILKYGCNKFYTRTLVFLVLCILILFINSYIVNTLRAHQAKITLGLGKMRGESLEINSKEINQNNGSEDGTPPEQLCQFPKLSPKGDNGQIFLLTEADTHFAPSCVTGLGPLFAVDLDNNLVAKLISNRIWSEVECQFREFYRQKSRPDFHFRFGHEAITIKEQVTKLPRNFENIVVTCAKDNGETVYTDYFPVVWDTFKEAPNPEHYNVLLLGMDTVSRMNFHRYMPQSLDYLMNRMGAVEFTGFNSLGSGSHTSLLPMYTGMQVQTEFRKRCHPNDKFQNGGFFQCSFIWEKYKSKGYITAYDEDSLDSYGIFNGSPKRGFTKQPFDLDFRTTSKFLQHLGKESVPAGFSNPCYGDRLSIEVLLENMGRVANTFKGKPHFWHSWSQAVTHDFNRLLQFADVPMLNSLKFLNENQLMEKTFLVLVSDHGMRFGRVRQSTVQGLHEERLPILYIAAPESFKRKYQKAFRNLQENAPKLVTALDVHETLVALLNVSQLSDENLLAAETLHGKPSGKQHLFQRVSPLRTCEHVGIPLGYCACTKRQRINITEDAIQTATNIVGTVNWSLTKFLGKCEELKLESVVQVYSVSSALYMHPDNFEITFRTTPGNGEFVVTLNKLQVEGRKSPSMDALDITRVTQYGSSGNCLKNMKMRAFCQCKNAVQPTVVE